MTLGRASTLPFDPGSPSPPPGCACRHLSEQHTATTIGVLLGVAADRRGSQDATASRMLFLHLPARHPTSFPEIELSPLVQVRTRGPPPPHSLLVQLWTGGPPPSPPPLPLPLPPSRPHTRLSPARCPLVKHAHARRGVCGWVWDEGAGMQGGLWWLPPLLLP